MAVADGIRRRLAQDLYESERHRALLGKLARESDRHAEGFVRPDEVLQELLRRFLLEPDLLEHHVDRGHELGRL